MNLPKNSGGTHCRTAYMEEVGAGNSAKYNFAQYQVHIKGKARACSAKNGIEA